MKKTLTTIGTCLLAVIGLAQPTTWTWAKGGTGIQSESGHAITTDLNNNIYTLGHFSSPQMIIGNHTVTSTDTNKLGFFNEIFLVKQDVGGNVLWAMSAGALQGSERGYAIDTDAQGNVYIAGSTTSTMLTMGTVTINKQYTVEDFLVAKIDASGNVL